MLFRSGRGGMGVVYQARQISLDRSVALKLLLTGPQSSATDRRRFRTEAEAAARLRHPGIVQIYEVGELEGQPYFTMEFVDGPSLSERIAQGPLPMREAVEIVHRIAEAVEHAHRMGVLHRRMEKHTAIRARGLEKYLHICTGIVILSSVKRHGNASHAARCGPATEDVALEIGRASCRERV